MELRQLEYFMITCEKAALTRLQSAFIPHSPM